MLRGLFSRVGATFILTISDEIIYKGKVLATKNSIEAPFEQVKLELTTSRGKSYSYWYEASQLLALESSIRVIDESLQRNLEDYF